MALVQSKDKKINTLSNLLINYASLEKLNFYFEDKDLSLEETFNAYGVLPLFLISTKDLFEKVFNKAYTAEELLNAIHMDSKVVKREVSEELREKDLRLTASTPKKHRLNIDFIEDDGSIFGFTARFNNKDDLPFAILASFAIEVVNNYVMEYKLNLKNEKIRIPLIELFESMAKKVNSREIKIMTKKDAALLYPDLKSEVRDEPMKS